MENKKIYDAQGNEIILSESDFNLCQVNKTIHDQDFKTKPTTFFKDALKRFCKNKSSVVAAVIIGILLLMSFIVPAVSIHDLDTPHTEQYLLSPKIFKTGTGFWDGTSDVRNAPYDVQQNAAIQEIAGKAIPYDMKYVLGDVKLKTKVINDKDKYAYGGVYVFDATDGIRFVLVKPNGKEELLEDASIDDEYTFRYDYLQHYNTFAKITQKSNVNLVVDFSDDFDENKVHGEYRIVLQYNDEKTSIDVLRDWTTDLSDFSINISEYLTEKGVSRRNKCRIRIDQKFVEGSDETKQYAALAINSINFSVGEETDLDEKAVEQIISTSITDANATKNLPSDNKKHPGYWQSSGVTNVISLVVTYASFEYDDYGARLGAKQNFEIGKSEMETYIAKGWCKYNFDIGPSSFVKISKRCPIDQVHDQKITVIETGSGSREVTNLVCDIQYYKYLGYEKMPRFIFGTDLSGYDVFTRAFYSLRTSLAVAFIIVAVCFIFGLVWGAISGYFGGNVDLFLERFCEILGGMPYIVLMTLAIIKFGNNILTFAMASCLTGWLGTASLTRTQMYRFKGREYVLASRTLGSKDTRLIFKHILPNSLGTIVTSSVLKVPGVIFSEASLAYLGLGLKGVNSFGVMLSENQGFLGSYPMLILFPATIISLLMISFNLFGNGLRDALNPSLKGSE